MRINVIVLQVCYVFYASRWTQGMETTDDRVLEAAASFADFCGGIPPSEKPKRPHRGHHGEEKTKIQPNSEHDDRTRPCGTNWMQCPFQIPSSIIYPLPSEMRKKKPVKEKRQNGVFRRCYQEIWNNMNVIWQEDFEPLPLISVHATCAEQLGYFKSVFQRTTSRNRLLTFGKAVASKYLSEYKDEEDPSSAGILAKFPVEGWAQDVQALCDEIGSCDVCKELFLMLYGAYLLRYEDEFESSADVEDVLPWLKMWTAKGEDGCDKETLAVRVDFDSARVEDTQHNGKVLMVTLTVFDFVACHERGLCVPARSDAEATESDCPPGIHKGKSECKHCKAMKISSCFNTFCTAKYRCEKNTKDEEEEDDDVSPPSRWCTYTPYTDSSEGCNENEICVGTGRPHHKYKGMKLFHLHTVHRMLSAIEARDFPVQCDDDDEDTTSGCYDTAGFSSSIGGAMTCLVHEPGQSQQFTVEIEMFEEADTILDMIFYVHDGVSSGNNNHHIFDHRKRMFQPEAVVSVIQNEGGAWLRRDGDFQCPFVGILEENHHTPTHELEALF